MKILIIEDEALLAMELEALIEEAGHKVAGWATSSAEARFLVDTTEAEIAFVDIHLNDGPTGIDVARYIHDRKRQTVVFLTANTKRIPEGFAGAVGVIAKPYTSSGLVSALSYLEEGIRRPPPQLQLPSGLTLSPAFHSAWAPA